MKYAPESYFGLIIVSSIIFIITTMYSEVSSQKVEQDRVTKLKQNCIDLNPKYGQLFKVKSGFFEGKTMVAVSADIYKVELQMTVSNIIISMDKYSVLCGDLEKVN